MLYQASAVHGWEPGRMFAFRAKGRNPKASIKRRHQDETVLHYCIPRFVFHSSTRYYTLDCCCCIVVIFFNSTFSHSHPHPHPHSYLHSSLLIYFAGGRRRLGAVRSEPHLAPSQLLLAAHGVVDAAGPRSEQRPVFGIRWGQLGLWTPARPHGGMCLDVGSFLLLRAFAHFQHSQ